MLAKNRFSDHFNSGCLRVVIYGESDYCRGHDLQSSSRDGWTLCKHNRLSVHQKVCKAFHMPLLQNACFHGMQLPPMQQHDQFYKYSFIVNSVTAPVQGQVVASMEMPRDQNTNWWRAYVMGETPEPSAPQKLPRRSPQTSQRAGPQFPVTPVRLQQKYCPLRPLQM